MDDLAQRSISDDWLRLIFRRIETLDDSAINMRVGFSSLHDYLLTISDPDVIDKLRYQNARVMLETLRRVLGNVKPAILKEKYDLMIKDYRAILEQFTKGIIINGVANSIINKGNSDVNRQTNFKLTPYFSVTESMLLDLYDSLIFEIKELLFMEGNLKYGK